MKIQIGEVPERCARSISPDEGKLKLIQDIMIGAFDRVPEVFRKHGYDLFELARKSVEEGEVDGLAQAVVNAAGEEVLEDPKRSSLPFDLDIRYLPDGSTFGASMTKGMINSLDLTIGKAGAERLLEDWYYRKNKRGIMNQFITDIGHELVHYEQKGFAFSSGKAHDISDTVPESEKEVIRKVIPQIKPLVKNSVEESVDYLKQVGVSFFQKEFDRFYNVLSNPSNSVQRWKRFIPPYLKSYYQSVSELVPEDMLRPAMVLAAGKLRKSNFSSLYDPGENTRAYHSDPKEIMAYAYSLVSKAKKAGHSREELIQAITNPEKRSKEMYPLEYYEELREMDGVSPEEKRRIWQKFLKHVHGYIEQIYGGGSAVTREKVARVLLQYIGKEAMTKDDLIREYHTYSPDVSVHYGDIVVRNRVELGENTFIVLTNMEEKPASDERSSGESLIKVDFTVIKDTGADIQNLDDSWDQNALRKYQDYTKEVLDIIQKEGILTGYQLDWYRKRIIDKILSAKTWRSLENLMSNDLERDPVSKPFFDGYVRFRDMGPSDPDYEELMSPTLNIEGLPQKVFPTVVLSIREGLKKLGSLKPRVRVSGIEVDAKGDFSGDQRRANIYRRLADKFIPQIIGRKFIRKQSGGGMLYLFDSPLTAEDLKRL